MPGLVSKLVGKSNTYESGLYPFVKASEYTKGLIEDPGDCGVVNTFTLPSDLVSK